jgi:molecular chaperone GrpE
MSKHFSHNEKHHEGSAGGREDGMDSGPEPRDAGTAKSARDQAGTAGAPGTDAGFAAGTAGSETPEPSAGKAAAEEADAGKMGTPVAGPKGETEGCPEDRIADLEAQLAEAKDQFLRKAADFENFRKRMNRDKQDSIDFANQSLLLDLIPVLDDFDRALLSAESSRDFTALYEGVGMIAKRLSSTLDSKWGLKGYVSVGMPFDPNFHEALMMDKSSAVTEQTVQMDLLKGYALKDRVIRSAKVKVLVPDPSAPAIEPPPAPRQEAEPAEGAGKEAGPESPGGETTAQS